MTTLTQAIRPAAPAARTASLDFDAFTRRFDHYLIDLWGVLWDGRENYPDSIEFCRRLLSAGKQVLFVSNCSEHVVEELVDRMREAGMAGASPDLLATTGQAMESWFRRHGLTGQPVYVFGGPDVWENVRRAGAIPVDMPEDGRTLGERAESPWLVVGGLLNFTWKRMSAVVTGVRAGGLKVLAPNPDLVVVEQSGKVALPAGMVAHVIETALPSARVEKIGKPYPFIYEYALERMGPGVRHDRAVMIGDSLATDIRGANATGIAGLLIGQGVHQSQSIEQLRQLAAARRAWPDYFAHRLACDEPIQPVRWREMGDGREQATQ